MPGFIHSKKDEKKWLEAKHAAAKSKGKSVEDLHDDDFALVNHIYQNMNKSLNKAIPKIPSISTTKIKSPMKVGTQATVKMPKSKKMPGALDKPSVFFKYEEKAIKQSSVRKLKVFLDKRKLRSQS